MTDAWLTWCSTYLVHSTGLIALVWVADRAGWLARLARGTQEWLWRFVLLGGVLSASVSVLSPAGGSPWWQAAPTVAAATEAAPASPGADLQGAQPVLAQTLVETSATVPAAPGLERVSALPAATSTAAPLIAIAGVGVRAVAADTMLAALVLWLAGASMLVLALAVSYIQLGRMVRRQPVLDDPSWARRLGELSVAAGVPSPRIVIAPSGWASPLLAPGGVLCLPHWCLALPEDEARSVIAHELAHLRRRDPLWRLGAALLQALLWPQLLNRVVLARLDLLAEIDCDDTAARSTGQPQALARSLLRCAEALVGARRPPALACGAASAPSPLRARVQRLLGRRTDAPSDRRVLRWGLPLLVLGGMLALPAVVVRVPDGMPLFEALRPSALAEAWFDRGPFGPQAGTRVHSIYPGGSFMVELDGQVVFNEAEDDLQSLKGSMIVRERVGNQRREMRLEGSGEGVIQREYRAADTVQPLDEAGQRWWAEALRRTAEQLSDPEARARQLFERGGAPAVLADLEKSAEGEPRRRRLMAAIQLPVVWPASALDRLIASAAQVPGAHERSQALMALVAPRRGELPEAQQIAWLRAVATVSGAFERQRALAVIAPRLIPTAAVVQAWQEALAELSANHELRMAIEAQVTATPQPTVLLAALRLALRLSGDFERQETLAAVARRFSGAETELVDAYALAAEGLRGGYERRMALLALLDRPALDARALDRTIALAEAIEPSHERLQVLLRVAARIDADKMGMPGLTDRLRRAGRGLGDAERGQLEIALDRLG